MYHQNVNRKESHTRRKLQPATVSTTGCHCRLWSSSNGQKCAQDSLFTSGNLASVSIELFFKDCAGRIGAKLVTAQSLNRRRIESSPPLSAAASANQWRHCLLSAAFHHAVLF
jgi:hypothetical protein